MNRAALIVVALAVSTAGCTSATVGPSGSAGPPDSAAFEDSTTTVGDTTTSQAPPTSATTTATPTTTPTTTSTTVVPPEAPEAAPTKALTTFRWEFATSIGAADTNLLSLSSSGIFDDGDVECRIVAGFGGFDFETGAILIGDEGYLDSGDGEGYQPVEVDRPDFQESLGLCAGSDRFWADMTAGEDVPAGGEFEERNGIGTRRLDLTGLVDQAGALGLVAPGVEGVSFEELTFWVANDGNWISSIVMNATLDAATLESITGSSVSEPGRIDITLDVTSPNDPALSVLAP